MRPRAVLTLDPRTEPDRVGFLKFEAPDGRIDVIEVTDGPTFERWPARPVYERGPVWHVDITDAIITVTPSIDIKNRYHTGSTVVFARVENLP